MNFNQIPKFSRIRKAHNTEWKDITHQLDWYKKSFDLDLDPAFQRGHVWTEGQQTAYIEFKLQGGKGGDDVYLNAPKYDDYKGKLELVDGKQRLTAIMKFLNNELRAFGLLHNEFEGKIDSDIQIIFNINNLDDQEVLKWYVSLNSGVAHSKEEIDRIKDMIKEQAVNQIQL